MKMKNGISVSQNTSSKNGNDKIELVHFPHDFGNCKNILVDINCFFHESEQYQHNKEYRFAIVSLKKAFEKTYELAEPLEQECAQLFRFTILESLKHIHQDLKRMTRGFFRRNSYNGIYLLAEETLKEFKKVASTGKQRNMQPYSDNQEGYFSVG